MRKLTAVLVIIILSVAVSAEGGIRIHPAYLNGYPDGTIRPYDTISRQELCQIILRLLPEDAPSQTCGYLDVLPQQWSYHAICTMITLEIYPPISSAYFEPKKEVSAEEFRQVLCNVGTYLDAKTDAQIAISGKAVTRAEAAKALNALLGRCKHPGMRGMLQWSDLSKDDACYFDLIEAANTHTAKDGCWTGLG